MKKKLICASVITAMMLAGCGQQTNDVNSNSGSGDRAVEVELGDSHVQEIVTAFFEGNYAYTRTTEEYLEDDPGSPTPTVSEGKIIASPYLEYIKTIDPEDEDSYTEVYLSGDGNTVDMVYGSDDLLAATQTERQYQYGYGQDQLVFQEIAQEKISGKTTVIYSTEYTVELMAPNDPDITLSAVIAQTYYIDEDNEQVVRIVTDLTDYTRKNLMLTDMLENGTTEAEAEKNVEPICKTDTLDITAYGDDVVIENSPFETAGDDVVTKQNGSKPQ